MRRIKCIASVIILLLSACKYDSDPVFIFIDSKIIPQSIHSGSRNVTIQPGLPLDEIKGTDVKGKLFVDAREFPLISNSVNPVRYISPEPCKDFGGGTKTFKYELFKIKDGSFYKSDSAQVTVLC